MFTVSGPISSSTYITSRYSGFFVDVDAHRQPLLPRALALQVLPARPRERLEVVLVRELRVRDRELALELLLAERLEALVRLGVDARDEERRDGVDLRRVAAARDEALEPAQVRLDDRLVAVEREDQRDVDRRAVRGAVLDRRQAGHRRRDLHVEVRALDLLRDPARLLERSLRVVRQTREHLHRHVAVRRLRSSRRRGAARRTRRGCPRARAGRRSPLRRRSSRGTRAAARRTHRPATSAFWKIDGFDVTPVTASSFIMRFSSPLWTRSRDSVSNQTDWPRAATSCRRDLAILHHPFHLCDFEQTFEVAPFAGEFRAQERLHELDARATGR